MAQGCGESVKKVKLHVGKLYKVVWADMAGRTFGITCHKRTNPDPTKIIVVDKGDILMYLGSRVRLRPDLEHNIREFDFLYEDQVVFCYVTLPEDDYSWLNGVFEEAHPQ